MMVRIPTGVQTLNVTSKANRLIGFQCQMCRKVALCWYPISATSSKQTHVLQSKEKKQSYQNELSLAAGSALEQVDSQMYRAINLEHDYRGIKGKIKCPHCGTVQIWSTYPHAKTMWIVLGILTFYMLLFGFACISDSVLTGIFFFASALLMDGLAALLLYMRRKKYKDAICSPSFPAPVYFSKEDIESIPSGPYKDEFLRLLMSKSL